MVDLLKELDEEINPPDLSDSPLIEDIEDVALSSLEIPGIRATEEFKEKSEEELKREKIILKYKKIRGLVLVAHPDDCLIFAHKFIRAHRSWEWDIVYLTYGFNSPRAQEVYKYWRRVEGVRLFFLNFPDNLQDLENNKASFTPSQVKERLNKIINLQGYSIILTHNKSGEYGHPHHRVAHYTIHDYFPDTAQVYFHGDSLEEHDKFKNKILFKEIIYDATPFTKEMFPLHWGVMETFDLSRSLYMIPYKAQFLLSELKNLERSKLIL